MIKPPCGEHCDKRIAGCHSTCEDYILYVKKREEERAMLHKAREKYYQDTRAKSGHRRNVI